MGEPYGYTVVEEESMDTPEKGERRIDIRCNKQYVVRIEIRTREAVPYGDTEEY